MKTIYVVRGFQVLVLLVCAVETAVLTHQAVCPFVDDHAELERVRAQCVGAMKSLRELQGAYEAESLELWWCGEEMAQHEATKWWKVDP